MSNYNVIHEEGGLPIKAWTNGVPLEVQIRTEDMHRLAENGIAAHWQYKTGEEAGTNSHERAREWLTGLMDMQDGGNPEEFFESVKVDLFPDKVYVFTPKGAILRLPPNGTERRRISATWKAPLLSVCCTRKATA